MREQCHSNLPDRHQNVWQLASVQLSGWTSIPILATSVQLLQLTTFMGAVLTIILGNAILFFIRIGIVTMSYEKRQSTLDLSQEYLGNFGKYLISILLIISTLAWFITQTTTASVAIKDLLPINEKADIDQFFQISVFLGSLSTLFCMGGIIGLRKLSAVAFPILLILFFAILYLLPVQLPSYEIPQKISFSGFALVLITNLGITSDLPTFFRHSASWKTSVKALLVIQLFCLLFGLASLYLGAILTENLEMNREIISSTNTLLKFLLIGFIFISVVCANVANVYSASVGWELLAPKALVGSKEYFILGLSLTTILILQSGLFSTDIFLQPSDYSMVNLCIILIVGYIVKKHTGKAPDLLQQTIYCMAWGVSTLVNSVQIYQVILTKFSYFSVSIAIIIIMMIVLYLVDKCRSFYVKN